jgi:hypothetical protein
VIVVVKAVLPEVGDVNVGPPIVVVVSDGNAESPPIVGDPGLLGDVCEGAVVVVVEQGCMRRRSFSIQSGFGASVNEIDIQPAVIVVVQQSYTGADRFQNVSLLRRAHLVPPSGEAGLDSDVFKRNRTRFDCSSSGYGPMVFIQHRSKYAGRDRAALGRRLRTLLGAVLLRFEGRLRVKQRSAD